MLEDSKRICNKLRALDDDNSRLRQVRLSDSEETSWAQNTNTWIRQCQHKRTRIYKLMKKTSINLPQIFLILATIIQIILARLQLIQATAEENTREHSSSTTDSCKDLINDLITMYKNIETTQNQLMAPTSTSITNNTIFSNLSQSDCDSIDKCGYPENLPGVETTSETTEQVQPTTDVENTAPRLTGFSLEKSIELYEQYNVYRQNGGEKNLAELISKDYQLNTTPKLFLQFTDGEVTQLLNNHFQVQNAQREQKIQNLMHQKEELQEMKQKLELRALRSDQVLSEVVVLQERCTNTRAIELYAAKFEEIDELRKEDRKQMKNMDYCIAHFDMCIADLTETVEHKAMRTENVNKLQALYRGHRSRVTKNMNMMELNKQLCLLNNAALRIQCMFRIHQARAVRAKFGADVVVTKAESAYEFVELQSNLKTLESKERLSDFDLTVAVETSIIGQFEYRTRKKKMKKKQYKEAMASRIKVLEADKETALNRVAFLEGQLDTVRMTRDALAVTLDLEASLGGIKSLLQRLAGTDSSLAKQASPLNASLVNEKAKYESIKEQQGAAELCESCDEESTDAELSSVEMNNYKHIRKKQAHKLLASERQLIDVQPI